MNLWRVLTVYYSCHWLQNMLRRFVINYINVILIYFDTWQSHNVLAMAWPKPQEVLRFMTILSWVQYIILEPTGRSCSVASKDWDLDISDIISSLSSLKKNKNHHKHFKDAHADKEKHWQLKHWQLRILNYQAGIRRLVPLVRGSWT